MDNVTEKKQPLGVFILMASITFMAILSEMVPSGILPQIMEGLNINEQQAGNLVGYYAIASAFCGIPIISYTVEWQRKRLLLILMAGFAISNIAVGLIPNYWSVQFFRVVGGICAGVLWPMIAAYGMKLVPDEEKGRTVAIIMTGTTLGMSFGLPAATLIGTHISWQAEFIVLGVVIAIIGWLCHRYLPEAPGDKRTTSNSPFTVLKNKGVLVIILLTFLAVVANYGVFTYITNLVETTQYPSLSLAQLIFGIGSLISVWITGRFIDKHLQLVDLTLLGASALAYAVFLWINGAVTALHLGFLLWGVGFGALVTLYQTAVARQVPANASAVATSLQSACFNFSIMIATWLGGTLLVGGSIFNVLMMALTALIVGIAVSLIAKKALA
ncbi:MFS transporter [Neisseria perflava]|uniref:MFS transporter n=1 Tax=Neisseria perflava TaxID=33053 RepID=UPI00209F0B48|nr:MFS transporter [Neisseria perflava]MCP1660627.1 putative MFS family arabinose efflux permease [Neisseria perflava]MCP1772373.1 putative MFS family arabinose efflux permease [Neisseria perflava]